MAVMPTTRLPTMTFEEFMEWADEDVHAEWVDGEVEIMSPASFAHQNLIAFLVAILRIFAEARGLGTVVDQPFVMKIGPRLRGREPDVLFIAAANIARIQRNHLEGPADLVIEIVSPESLTRDLQTKWEEYRHGGVREYWALNPMEQRPQFWQLQADGTYLAVAPDENGIYHSAAMAGLWINVNWLWQNPLPAILDVLRQWGLV